MEDSKVAIILEDIKSQFKVFGEGLVSLEDKVDKGFEQVNNRIDKLETRMDRIEGKMDHIEEKLDNHIKANQENHEQIMKHLDALDDEVQTELKSIK